MTYDVLVIGCGPVGALAANLLARAGLRTAVVEQEAEPHPLPRAVHLDHEAMRILQAAGVIARVAPGMRETEGHLHIGADRGVIRYMGTIGRPKPFGWANDYFFYQPELEAQLREALGDHPNVDLELGARFEELVQDEAGVTAVVSTAAGRRELRARWVVACDGARSAVRKQLGVGLDDLDFEEPWLVVDAELDGPVQFPSLSGVPQSANLQQLSVMMCDPQRPATIVPGRGEHRRWEFMLLPGEDDEEMMRAQSVAELLAPWVEGVPHRIIRAATYRFHGLIAERWQVGRVFLAGDAAHQTPPFFGQGMCHGFRDVANLTWKLALVAAGKADPALLGSYQPERDPHVRHVITAAVEAGRYICLLDPAEAAARDARMREQARSAAPSTAADLIPPIRDGVVALGTPAAGERFIQPKLETEAGARLLDDVVDGWRLIVRGRSIAEAARSSAGALVDVLPLAVVAADELRDGGLLGAWLDVHGAAALVVRPDFYVFGGAAEAAGIAPLLHHLAAALAGSGERGALEDCA